MRSSLIDRISEAEKEALGRLSLGKRKGGFFSFLTLSILALILCYVIYAGGVYLINGGYSNSELASSLTRHDAFTDISAQYESWVSTIAGKGAASLFNKISSYLIANDSSFPLKDTLASKAWHGLHVGLMRAFFILISWWKVWIVAIVASFFFSIRRWGVHRGENILGIFSNGRLFYSGIKMSLNRVTERGEPDIHVPGFACPKSIGKVKARYSELGKLLHKWGADTETNLELAGIILAYSHLPAYAARGEAAKLVENTYLGCDLATNAYLLVQKALEVHSTYRDEEANAGRQPPITKSSLPYAGKISPEQHVEAIGVSFQRVLTQTMRKAISEVNPEMVATVVLAIEAGKTLAFGREGDRIVLSSSFPHLSARAVLHSIPSYAVEYSADERTIIRRAIIYGSRKSIYGPVRFVLDMCEATRALRQWVEILMSLPHEIGAVSDEVELYGLMHEFHTKWISTLKELITSRSPLLKHTMSDGIAFFVPFKLCMKLIYELAPSASFKRLIELNAGVWEERKKASGRFPDYERMLKPLCNNEIAMLAKDHSISTEDLSVWSAFRNVFNHYSWLGRRVGDNTVPESSIVYLETGHVGLASAKSVHKGIVVFRATRLEENIGDVWKELCEEVSFARIIDDKAEYERLKLQYGSGTQLNVV